MFIQLKQKPMFYSASAKAISSAAAIMSSRDCGFADMSLKPIRLALKEWHCNLVIKQILKPRKFVRLKKLL